MSRFEVRHQDGAFIIAVPEVGGRGRTLYFVGILADDILELSARPEDAFVFPRGVVAEAVAEGLRDRLNAKSGRFRGVLRIDG